MLEGVDHPRRAGTRPETKQTLDRLSANGYSPAEGRRLIAMVVAREVFAGLPGREPYHEARAVAGLRL